MHRFCCVFFFFFLTYRQGPDGPAAGCFYERGETRQLFRRSGQIFVPGPKYPASCICGSAKTVSVETAGKAAEESAILAVPHAFKSNSSLLLQYAADVNSLRAKRIEILQGMQGPEL